MIQDPFTTKQCPLCPGALLRWLRCELGGSEPGHVLIRSAAGYVYTAVSGSSMEGPRQPTRQIRRPKWPASTTTSNRIVGWGLHPGHPTGSRAVDLASTWCALSTPPMRDPSSRSLRSSQTNAQWLAVSRELTGFGPLFPHLPVWGTEEKVE